MTTIDSALHTDSDYYIVTDNHTDTHTDTSVSYSSSLLSLLRYVVQPANDNRHALEPSLFWELKRAGRQRDTFPVQLNSNKDAMMGERR